MNITRLVYCHERGLFMEKDYRMKGCPTLDFACPYFYQGFCQMDNPEQECEDMMFELEEGESYES